MNIKIGWDATPLLGQRSGVGNYTGRLLAALLAEEQNWEHLLYSNRPLGLLEGPLANAVPIEGYLQRSRWLWMQARLPAIIQRTQPQLCHFTNALAPIWQPKPFVLTIHDASLILHRKFHPRTRLLTMRLLLPIVARRAAAVIAVSEHARHDLMRTLNIPAEKLHTIYEAAPESFRRVNDQAQLASLRQKYQLPEHFLLFVGTLEPRKNLTRLVRAFHKVRQAGYPHKLIMVGPTGWLMNGFAHEIENLGVGSAIQFTGYVPSGDLPGLFSLATFFVFPSLYEGFGLPPLEAMACGTPVLSSNRSSMAEICADAAHLVDPEDEESLTEGLIRLLKDEELRQELSGRGLERAKHFSWQRAAQETAGVYRKVLNGL